jgi:hypothetical protein
MKKCLVFAVIAGLMPSVLMAKGHHPMAGCGLAYMLFSKDSNSKGVQILASTTNNIYGTQTFGITSGTSGCTEQGTLAMSREAEVYAEINLKDLSRDMVSGGGEYLSSFASLLNIRADRKADFFQLCQAKYGDLFPTANTSSTQLMENLKTELQARPDLRA